MSRGHQGHQDRGRQRTSRWGSDNQTSELTGLGTAITAAMTTEQLEAYVLHFRIEEISQALRLHDTGRPDPRIRSPSPPPEYDATGRRINTRERRHRQRLEEERQRLINTALKTFDGYKAPRDFKLTQRNGQIREKVFIPVMDFPTLNFIGQILGPRSQSLRQMNAESGANIVIRGKGSAKEGSSRSLRSTDDTQEPLHCLITGDSQQKVEKGKELISRVIETVVTMPEDQNERKRDQLRQLAQLNGTFRDDEQQACENCGHHGHRQYAFPEPKRFSANVTCHSCHNAVHLARDCPDRRGPGTGSVPPWRKERMAARMHSEVTETDRDFAQFLLELGK